MVKLSALAGKPVVLFAYAQGSTGTCKAEVLDFSAAAPDFRRAGVQLFGVSPETVEKHRKFKAKQKVDLTLLADPGHILLGPWGCWGEKEMFGRRYTGIIRSTFLIDAQGRIAQLWRHVRIAGHAAAVLAAARDLP